MVNINIMRRMLQLARQAILGGKYSADSPTNQEAPTDSYSYATHHANSKGANRCSFDNKLCPGGLYYCRHGCNRYLPSKTEPILTNSALIYANRMAKLHGLITDLKTTRSVASETDLDFLDGLMRAETVLKGGD